MGRIEHNEMKLLYKGHWSTTFSMDCHNIRTGNLGNTHSCTVCNKRPTLNCYLNLHLAFCIAEVDVGDGKMDICGERFAPKSPAGCATHTHGGGYNTMIKEAWKKQKTITEAFEEMEQAERLASIAAARPATPPPPKTQEEYQEEAKQKLIKEKWALAEARAAATIANADQKSKAKRQAKSFAQRKAESKRC